ncbi:hypothetical protein ElyMa_001252400 [Elysia marginata]|uniref:Uncharacterized protein n=1 Tax=Elysia marginata TaxID=1093978 RepID=A0AAV4IAV4_9GAST|nr:hypothetical protein ElyMa_001252400 [Elysia marginata]
MAQQKFPGDHQNHVHTKLDFNRLHAHIKPVYERLSHADLMQRCLGHKTQNANESLHNSIWSKCNKSQCHPHDRVEFSMLSGIAEFNFGPTALSHVENEVYEIAPGPSTNRLRSARSRKRLEKSKDAAKGKEKARKAKRTEAINRREADTSRDYGDTGYGAGQY